MSAGEQFIGEVINSFGGLVSLFFTSLFNAFVAPIFITIATTLGLTPVT